MTVEAVDAVEKLKSFLEQDTLLYNPDFTLPLYLATDASNCGMGSLLYQVKIYEKTPKGKSEMISDMGFEPDEQKHLTSFQGLVQANCVPW